MLPLPENRILKGLVYMTTISVVVCYAWLAARMMETSFEPPAKVISSVYYRSEGTLQFFNEVTRKLPNESTQVMSETLSLNEKFAWLGDLKKPIRLIVDADHDERLAVTDARIEIGTRVLMARGQLKKAILKAWLLQNVSPEVSKSFLRIEVASDVLLAMLEGRFSLEAPGAKQTLEFDTGERAWWSFADSYQGICKTEWRSLELSALCASANSEVDAVAVSALSFRPFLASRIWKSYRAVPVARRLQFTKSWLASLAQEASAETLTVKKPNASGWLGAILTEMESLLPGDIDPLFNERALWKPTFDAPLIVIDEDGRVAAPGSLKIASGEITIRKAKLAMLTACAAPTLGDVIGLSVDSLRVVWRPACASRGNDFVQVRVSSVRLAIAKGLAKPSDRLDLFVARSRQIATSENDVFGLKRARWDQKAKAYQVIGAIEAVEWYHLSVN